MDNGSSEECEKKKKKSCFMSMRAPMMIRGTLYHIRSQHRPQMHTNIPAIEIPSAMS